MSFPFRTELVAENTIFGTQQTVWKEKLWVKSVLEENIRTVRFTTDGSLRLLSVGIFIQSFERQASGTVLQLAARKLYWYRLHFSSVCLVRMYCVIIADHKRMWVIPCQLRCTILQCASYNFCSCISTEKKYRMRPTSKWEVSLHEDLENQLHLNKKT